MFVQRVVPVILLVIFLSSCARISSLHHEAALTGIKEHAYQVPKAMVIGAGVSQETATRIEQRSKAVALYSLTPVPPPAFRKPGRRFKVSSYAKDLVILLREMMRSGDPWEVSVLPRARWLFRDALSRMRDGEMEGFRGRLLVSESAKEADEALRAQIYRVWGADVMVDFVEPQDQAGWSSL